MQLCSSCSFMSDLCLLCECWWRCDIALCWHCDRGHWLFTILSAHGFNWCAGSVKESSFFVLFHGGQMTIMYLALSFHTPGEKSASFITSWTVRFGFLRRYSVANWKQESACTLFLSAMLTLVGWQDTLWVTLVARQKCWRCYISYGKHGARWQWCSCAWPRAHQKDMV